MSKKMTGESDFDSLLGDLLDNDDILTEENNASEPQVADGDGEQKPLIPTPLFGGVSGVSDDDEEISVANEVSDDKSNQEENKVAPLFSGGILPNIDKKEQDSSNSGDNIAKEVVDDIVDEPTEVVVDDTGGLDLLDDLMDEPLSEKASGEVVYDNPEYDVVVSPDGKTLSELVMSKRKGNITHEEMIDDLVDSSKNVEIDGVDYADTRYKDYAIDVEKTKKKNEENKRMYNKFLQKNSEFTPHEKIIMENLGIENGEFAKLMDKKNLTDKEREIVLAAGKHGAEKYYKGRRYRTTVGDTTLIEFLTIFKFANTRVLRWLKDEPQSKTWRRLNRLQENGLVASKTVIGMPDLWGVTAAGVALSGYDYKPSFRRMPKIATISSNMGVNYLAACLWFNTVNVLNLDDFPANNRIISDEDGTKKTVRGEMLVSEMQIRSSMGKLVYPGGSFAKNRGELELYEAVALEKIKAFDEWKKSGMKGHSPEWELGNEYMWTLYPKHKLTLSYHVPDLVVRRERNSDGTPNSIAVELERYSKSSNRYEEIMRAYKLDNEVYKKVIWVTPNAQVAKQLKDAAEKVGFEDYDIVPVITKDGTFNSGDIWMI